MRSVDVELKRRCETGCGAAVRHEEDEQGDAQRHHQEGEHHLGQLEHSKSQVCFHKNCYGKESHKGNAQHTLTMVPVKDITSSILSPCFLLQQVSVVLKV